MLRIFYPHRLTAESEQYTFALVRWVLDGLAILLVFGLFFVGAAIAFTLLARM